MKNEIKRIENNATELTANTTIDEYLIDLAQMKEDEIYDFNEDKNNIRRYIADNLDLIPVKDVKGWTEFFNGLARNIKTKCDECNSNKEIEFGSPEHLRTYVQVKDALDFLGKYCVLPKEIVKLVLDPYKLYPQIEYCMALIKRRGWELDYPLIHMFDGFCKTIQDIKEIPEDVQEKLDAVLEIVNPWFDQITKYGYLDKKRGEIVTDVNQRKMMQGYRSLSSEEVLEYGGGVCWDATRFVCETIRKTFPELPVTNYIIYIYDKLEGHVGMNHSYPVIEIAPGYYLHVELAYRGCKGIYLARTPYAHALSFVAPIAGTFFSDLELRKYEFPDDTGYCMDDFTEIITSDTYSKPVEFPYANGIGYDRVSYEDLVKVIRQVDKKGDF